MKQGIFRRVRFVAAIACLAFATSAHARDLAWTYVDDGARIDAAITEAGDVIALTSTTTKHAIVRVTPDGRVAWRREFDGAAAASTPREPDFANPQAPPGARIAADRTCWASYVGTGSARSLAARCLRLADGTTIWEQTFAAGLHPESHDFAWTVLADGTMTLIAGSSGSYSVRRIGASGENLGVRPVPGVAELLLPAFDAGGRLVFRTSTFRSDLIVLDRDGGTLMRPTQEGVGLFQVVPGFASDGTVMAVGLGDDQRHIELRALASDGTAAWEVEPEVFGNGCCLFMGDARFHVVDGQDVVVFRIVSSTGPTYVINFDTVAHRMRWYHRAELRPGSRASIVEFGPDGRAFGVNTFNSAALSVALLDARSGASPWTEYFNGLGFGELAPTARMDASDTLRVAADRDGKLVVAAMASALDRPAVRADQEGIDGAWYPSYDAGQGIVVDYIPTTRTLFLPWFTFSGVRYDVSSLHWYSLQGQVAEGASEVELNIYENRGGAFAEPPVTRGGIRGTARLRFESCDVAHLSWIFPAVDPTRPPVTGEMSLSRLTPRRVPCGTTVAPTIAARGFDVRQSGSWYDPETSGQGLMLTVDPDGPLFAAWFTYDPALRPDDVERQHWLSLGADLTTAQDGQVLAPIYRTTQALVGNVPAPRTTQRVGEATLRFEGCDRLRVDYRFDALPPSDPFFGTPPGTLNLVPIGGCSNTNLSRTMQQ